MLMIYRRLGESVWCENENGAVAVVSIAAMIHPNAVKLRVKHPDGTLVHYELQRERDVTIDVGGTPMRILNAGASSAGMRVGFDAPRNITILRIEIVRNRPRDATPRLNEWEFSEGILP